MVGEVVIPLFPPLLNDPQHSITLLSIILGLPPPSTINLKELTFTGFHVMFSSLFFFSPHTLCKKKKREYLTRGAIIRKICRVLKRACNTAIFHVLFWAFGPAFEYLWFFFCWHCGFHDLVEPLTEFTSSTSTLCTCFYFAAIVLHGCSWGFQKFCLLFFFYSLFFFFLMGIFHSAFACALGPS